MRNNTFNINCIANYFICKGMTQRLQDKEHKGKYGINIQRLLSYIYLSQAWSLAICKKKLFLEEIHTWGWGPVVPQIYHEFKNTCGDVIDRYSQEYNMIKDESVITLLMNGKTKTQGQTY